VRINLTDTAGLGDPGDEIERIGIERSRKSIAEASLVLIVIDASAGITPEDRDVIDTVQGSKKIYLLNKIDKVEKSEAERIIDESGINFIPVSAKTGEGFRDLENSISRIISEEFAGFKNSFLADARIMTILEKSAASAKDVMSLLEINELPEIVAFELGELMHNLEEITGEVTPDDVLGSIFSRFCIGK